MYGIILSDLIVMGGNMKIAYIGGGSISRAPKFFADLLLQNKVSGELALYDIKQKKTITNTKYFHKLIKSKGQAVQSEWLVSCHKNIDSALEDADFVIISITAGSLYNIKNDIFYARKYDVCQTTGDTVGVGGYSNALRTIPAIRCIGQKVKEICPAAYVVCDANPIDISLYTLYSVFPDIKALGYNNDVLVTQKLLCDIYDLYNSLDDQGKAMFIAGDYKGVSALLNDPLLRPHTSTTSIKDIEISLGGISHFVWLTEASIRGLDLMSVYRGYAEMIVERNNSQFFKKLPRPIRCANNRLYVGLIMYLNYGYIAAACGRRIVEFLSDIWLCNRKDYVSNGFRPASIREQVLNTARNNLMQRLGLYAPNTLRLEASDNELTALIAALAGKDDAEIVISQPAADNAGLMMQTQALCTANGITAMAANLPTGEIGDRILTHARNQRDFVKAYLNRDTDALLDVFCKDYSIAHLSADKKRSLFEELVAKNKSALEDFMQNF